MTQGEPSETLPREPAQRTSCWKKPLLRLALLACTLSGTLLVLEAATRLLTDTTPSLMERNPIVGQRFLPCFEGEVYDDEAGREVFLRFSRDGLRGPDRPREKPAGIRRLAIFGDSMVASVGVDEADSMTARLERMLNDRQRGVRWEVLNCGVSGSSTGQQMVLYREVVSQYRPEIVLGAFFVGNDLCDNSCRLSSNPRIYFDLDASGNLVQLPFSAKRAIAGQWLNRHSRFYVWQKNAMNNARHRVSAGAGAISPGDWVFCSRESQDIAHAWQLTAALLAQFQREVENRGGRFAVVLVPSAMQVCDDCFQALVSNAREDSPYFDPLHPNRRLAEICRRAGIPLWPLTDDFRRAAPSADSRIVSERLFLKGVGHFNEQGSLVAARSIYRFLTEGDPERVAGVPLLESVR
ncbi:MAG: hypothetical protein HUU20_04620 [Pirellulales bacterium]|nr:hypothetical protein [Pirellulales bacterium]